MNKYPTFESAKARAEELEKILAVKGTKAIKKTVTPQPIKDFYTADIIGTLFKQLLKVYEAKCKIGARELVYGEIESMDELSKRLGELIIIATSYLDKIDCDEFHRQLLFADLNRRNNDVAFTR